MRPSISILLACCLLVQASGCGSNEGPAVTDAERQVGAETHPQLLAEFGGEYRGDEADFLAAVGEKVAGAAGLQAKCKFTLVNSDVVNAFAVPGCYIYVTRGLMSIVNSEGELASVLAHEVGHIAANHSERQQQRSLIRSLGVLAMGVLTGSERISRIASAAAGYFTLRYSRKHEYEADDLGLSYLRNAGYDPFAAAEMLAALGRHTEFLTRSRERDEARSIPEWALTHPLTENRIDRAKANVEKMGLQPDQLPENEPAYLRAVDGMLYGDDPEQGFVLGRRFAHPVMRISFEAPQGFRLTNSREAILIDGPGGLRGEFSGGRTPSRDLRAYTEAVLADLLGNVGAESASLEQGTVNGLPTIMVRATVRTEQGPLAVTVAAYDAGGGDAYHFAIVSPSQSVPEASLRALFESFRLLTTAEAASLRPRRIEVETVNPAETLQSIARRMAVDMPVEHFLMINGRTSDVPLRPGEQVKIIVLAG
jgi:predicted Zn-dependent protease